jgi:hypothetical protein
VAHGIAPEDIVLAFRLEATLDYRHQIGRIEQVIEVCISESGGLAQLPVGRHSSKPNVSRIGIHRAIIEP